MDCSNSDHVRDTSLWLATSTPLLRLQVESTTKSIGKDASSRFAAQRLPYFNNCCQMCWICMQITIAPYKANLCTLHVFLICRACSGSSSARSTVVLATAVAAVTAEYFQNMYSNRWQHIHNSYISRPCTGTSPTIAALEAVYNSRNCKSIVSSARCQIL
jgi:hypothetical protein